VLDFWFSAPCSRRFKPVVYASVIEDIVVAALLAPCIENYMTLNPIAAERRNRAKIHSPPQERHSHSPHTVDNNTSNTAAMDAAAQAAATTTETTWSDKPTGRTIPRYDGTCWSSPGRKEAETEGGASPASSASPAPTKQLTKNYQLAIAHYKEAIDIFRHGLPLGRDKGGKTRTGHEK
jgi:hypothetical protein